MTNKELPNQEPTTKDKPVCRDYRLTEEVGEALEEVKKIISFYGDEEKTVLIKGKFYQLPNHSDEMFRGISNLVNALDKSLAHPNTQENPVSSIVGQAREYKDTKQEVCIPKGETKIQNLERGMERLEQKEGKSG